MVLSSLALHDTWSGDPLEIVHVILLIFPSKKMDEKWQDAHGSFVPHRPYMGILPNTRTLLPLSTPVILYAWAFLFAFICFHL